MNTRRISAPVRVGNVVVGGDAPIRVQSMTNVDTNDTCAAVEQILRIVNAGGEIVRLTTQGRREAENMYNIRKALRERGCDVPLVADVHLNADVADIAARCCEKVRINPGNYTDPARRFIKHEYTDEEYNRELRKAEDRFTLFLNVCKAHGTAVRIGVNHGSLSDRIRNRYGDTPEGIVESCMEFLRVCKREGFRRVVVSIKASNTVVMVRSVRLLVEAMDSEDMHYPLHLGVTEAGQGEDGRIKSALGIGALLTEGIGDTIRVSLSEEPEAEIPVAKKLVEYAGECVRRRREAEITGGVLRLYFNEKGSEDLALKAAMTASTLLIDRRATGLEIYNNDAKESELSDAILQAAGLKFTKTEFISCPGCGRTLYDLNATVTKVKSALTAAAQDNPRINTLKVAIMGCIVNGPGEMADADYGYVGAGPHKVSLYKGKECVEKNISEEAAVEHLLRLICRDGAKEMMSNCP
ncbi:MAG: (E)-4-hydroxy-3-methylbut-2-enyl-diphosphate synthase [Prevotella sp.]|nr:(E)-4-hydroxy-3-methylbut-2-enyl-diphosphate synthase [Prevotella sp.]